MIVIKYIKYTFISTLYERTIKIFNQLINVTTNYTAFEISI